jgi:hypothetical protein
MKRKERYIVRPDEVVVTRQGEAAEIRYKEEGVPTTHLTIGSRIARMTDAEIVDLFNEVLRAQTELAAQHPYVAIEVPLNSPQIEYHQRANQWSPRGGVVRCEVLDDEEGRLVVGIDDRELTLEEFGRMLTVYAGWGMRIEFTPREAVHRRPDLRVEDPAEPK